MAEIFTTTGAAMDSSDSKITVLQIRNLRKSFSGNAALMGVSLEIYAGEIHVLVGQNGSGKSTVIKILSGYHIPDEGSQVLIDDNELQFGSPEQSYRLGCRFVHQDLGLVDSSSILDNLSFGSGYPTRLGTISRRRAIAEAREILRAVSLELDPTDLVKNLTASEKTGVAIARALRSDPAFPPRLLVLDEPTATLPTTEVARLISTCHSAASQGVGIMFVTHHLEEVFEVADRVSVLRDGMLVATSEINQIDRAFLVRQLVNDDLQTVVKPTVTSSGADTPVLDVERLSAGPLLDISLRVTPGEIVGCAGLTGSGREILLGAIFGAEPRSDGIVRINGKTLLASRPDLAVGSGVAYLAPDRKTRAGIMSMSAQENMTIVGLRRFWKKLLLNRKSEAAEAQKWFTLLDVRPKNSMAQTLASFSGGNQQKILFGKWIRQEPVLFLLDEPTQGVDVGAKANLHHALSNLAQDGAAVVISSTDIDELVTICNRVLIIHNGRLLIELKGDEITHSRITGSFMPELKS
jgi:ribose transport system ATP-binding protein